MKLHRMPHLVQRMILEELGFDESKSKVSVRVQKPRAPRIPDVINEWEFNIPYKQYLMNDSPIWKIDGTAVQVEKYDSTILCCGLIDERVGSDTTSNSFVVFGKVLRHLNSVLNIERCQLCEFDMTIPVGLIPQLDFNFYYGRIDFLSGDSMFMTLEDLTVLLENIKTKQLCLIDIVLSVPGYKYQKNPEKKSSIDCLKIRNFDWVDFPELPAAKRIIISRKIEMDQMNMVLTSWVAGRNREIEIGEFETDEFSDRNRETIYTGIETHAPQLTKAEITSFFDSSQHSLNLRLLRNIVAVDILRESDGIRATIIEAAMESHVNQKLFVFVWSDSNLRTIGRANN
ncbi:hypothetical protein B9Z55_003288 [Caenorhabditis nigoni]|uniref:F-box associated domain-containing protein n=1 Tax=Caenorhabditis nigoni TaxID=1611254 RepID=A0A2G5VQ37_9PELO|nr:hypothetical protein B9Z55_003288 [Caenorhabditis nigoni]